MRRTPGIAIIVTCAAFAVALLPADENRSGFDKPLAGDAAILHALDRLTYGPRPGDVEAVKSMGLNRWIDQQLHPETIAENPAVVSHAESEPQVAQTRRPADVPPGLARTLRAGTAEEDLAMLSKLTPQQELEILLAMPLIRQRVLPLLDQQEKMKLQGAGKGQLKQGGKQTIALAQDKFFRAIESNRQLEQVLADFWFNHFNVDAAKGADKLLITAYDRDVIRPHVLGKFRDLLEATATSPAMMFYLDNWQSTRPLPPNPNRPKQADRGLNENYARELMELHTLGVDGGYTQKDVTEVARCFTGWSVQTPRLNGPFVYKDALHDQGEKIVLGVRIPAGGGQDDGEKVLDILARHPSTARFISKELAQRFVADDPPQALVDRMAKTFRDTDGDIRAVLTTMFHSPEFFSEGAYRAKLKTPFEMMVSAVRATDATVNNAASLAARIGTLGEPLYRKVEPTGYSNLGSEWMNSAALMGRMNFAMDLAQNQLPGVTVDNSKLPADPRRAARSLLFTDPSQTTLDAIGSQPDPAVIAGMLLGSPDFQRK